jgi:hypothetical protein
MINRSVATSVQVMHLKNDTHRLLFLLSIPHLDRDGKMTGNARAFRATVCPMLDHVTDQTVVEAFADFRRSKLVAVYTDVQGQEVYWAPGFARQQAGMRYGRESESKFGGPPPSPAKTATQAGPAPARSGSGPVLSASGPDVDPKLSNHAESSNSVQAPDQSRSRAGGLRLNGIEGKRNQNGIEDPDPSSLSPKQLPRVRETDAPEAPESREREISDFAPEATRLDPNWEPSEDFLDWAAKDPWVDMPRRVALSLRGYFRDKWLGMPGPGALRVDWNAQARIFYRGYREQHPGLPRQSQMVVQEDDDAPPPKHPSLARLEEETRAAEASPAPSSSDLVAAIGRVGVAGPEET